MPKRAAKKKAEKKRKSSVTRILDVKPGKYADGLPLNEIQYLECKLILRPNHFTSRKSFFDFARIMRRPAAETNVEFSTEDFVDAPLQIREVLFVDTADFRFYNNAFILRRRIPYEDGFPVGDPEIVFKFRHPDIQTAAEMDVRPNIAGNYEIKFKVEALPLKEEIGGMRMLYSHNVQFPLSQAHVGDRTAMSTLVHAFPPLRALKTSAGERVELVNHTAVAEVLLDIARLDFGKGTEAKSNVAIWRTRGDMKQLIGEFAFQCKFKRGDEFHAKAKKRAEQFFISLQHLAQ